MYDFLTSKSTFPLCIVLFVALGLSELSSLGRFARSERALGACVATRAGRAASAVGLLLGLEPMSQTTASTGQDACFFFGRCCLRMLTHGVADPHGGDSLGWINSGDAWTSTARALYIQQDYATLT